jgi:hypothetical protein
MIVLSNLQSSHHEDQIIQVAATYLIPHVHIKLGMENIDTYCCCIVKYDLPRLAQLHCRSLKFESYGEHK